MPIPLIPVIGWVAVITVAGAAGYGLYQLRFTVKEVTEVFTAPSSVLNSGILQLSIGAIAFYVATKALKGK
jgi:hypothetical protein